MLAIFRSVPYAASYEPPGPFSTHIPVLLNHEAEMVKKQGSSAIETPAEAGWRSRIVETGVVDPNTLTANPKNWRVHPQHQESALTTVLDKVGWVQTVLVNKRTGRMIDGHLRVACALRKRETVIPVSYVDLSEEEENLILATLDPISALAASDSASLKSLLESLNSDTDLTGLLDSVAAKYGILDLIDFAPLPLVEDEQASRDTIIIKLGVAAESMVTPVLEGVRQLLDENPQWCTRVLS